MENHRSTDDPTPPDCFRLEELQQLQLFEGQVLSSINYYFWLNQVDPANAPYRFLFFLELIFDDHPGSLLLTSGEDTAAIQVSDAETLVKTAEVLRALHNQIVIQRVAAEGFPLWTGVCGKELMGIRLSKNESDLYVNDALLLDFDKVQILVRLSQQEGLEVGKY